MERVLFFTFIITLLMSFNMVFADDLNITFEDDTDIANWDHHDETNNWTTEAWNATGGVGGSGALELGDGGFDMIAKRAITATAGTNFKLTIDIKTENWDDQTTYPIYVMVQGIDDTPDTVYVNGSTDFTTFTVYGTAATADGYIRIRGLNTSLANKVWVDNVNFDDDYVAPPDLFFSEYAEGSSSNKYVEIYNGTGADVDLSSYSVQGTNNGTAWGDNGERDVTLSGTLVAGDVFILAADAADASILAQADTALAYESPVHHNGDDGIALLKNGTIIDVIGVELNDPGAGWDVAGVTEATKDHTLIRKASVTTGNTDWAASAGTTTEDSEWEVYDKDTWNYLGMHPGHWINVTFHVNSSTVYGLTDSNSVVDLRGTVTQWGPGTDMTNVGGDYWSITITLEPNTDYYYKFGARDSVSETIINEWWENDIPGADWQGPSDRSFTTGSEDMVLDLDYLGRGPNNNFPPYTPSDSVDIYIKVNMSGNELFDPATESPSVVGHFPAPDGEDNMWSPGTYKFTRIADSDYWEFHLKLAQSYVDTVENIKFDSNWPDDAYGLHMYRFAINDWPSSENLQGKYFPGNENRVLYLKNTTKDTTLVWKYWNDTPPAGATIVTSIITWRASTEALEEMGLFDRGVGDKIEIRGPKGWDSPDALQMDFNPLLREWTTSNQEFTNAVGAEYGYKYFVAWDSSRIDPTSPNYIEHLTLDGAGWEEPSVSGGGNRVHVFQDAAEQTPEGDFGFDRQFFNGIPANGVIDHNVTVTFNIDMTKAASGTDNPDNPLFVAGTDTVWITWDGELNGITQGYTRDSIFVELSDSDQDMVYSGSFEMVVSTAFPKTSFQFGYRVIYSSVDGNIYNGGGFDYGRRYYQYINPTSLAEGSPWPIPEWPAAYDFPTVEWTASDLYVETPPNLTSSGVGIDEKDKTPRKFALEQNFPNPFNPTTTINYELAKSTKVKISVYNIMGQEVKILVSSKQNAGKHTAVWNGTNHWGTKVTSGIYFVKMKSNNFTKVRKMTLLK